MANSLVLALLIASAVSQAVSYDNNGWQPDDRNARQRMEPPSTSTTPRRLPNLVKEKRDEGVEAIVDIQVNGWEATATVEFYPESTMSTTTSSIATTSGVNAKSDSPSPVLTAVGSTGPSWTTAPTTIRETSEVSPTSPTETGSGTLTTTETITLSSTVEESSAASTYGPTGGPTGTAVAATESPPSISSQNTVSVITVTVTDTVTTASPTSVGSSMISSPAFVNMTSCRPTGNWTSPWANLTGLTAWPCVNWTAPPLLSGTSSTTSASSAGTIDSTSSMIPSSTVGLQSLQLSQANHFPATAASSLVLCIAIITFHFM